MAGIIKVLHTIFEVIGILVTLLFAFLCVTGGNINIELPGGKEDNEKKGEADKNV